MKLALRVLVLVLLAAPACRAPRYFVDMDRALNETEDGRRVAAETARDFEAKRREFAEVDAVAKKAEEAKLPTAGAERAKANETAQRLQREMDGAREASKAKLVAGVRKALAKLAVEKGVDVIDAAAGVAFVAAGADLTDETIKRVNAAGGKSELEALRAKVSALEKSGKP